MCQNITRNPMRICLLKVFMKTILESLVQSEKVCKLGITPHLRHYYRKGPFSLGLIQQNLRKTPVLRSSMQRTPVLRSGLQESSIDYSEFSIGFESVKAILSLSEPVDNRLSGKSMKHPMLSPPTTFSPLNSMVKPQF